MPTSQDMTIIVTEFGEFKYNCPPMCMRTSVYILQAKVNKILCDIKCIKTYINYILFLSKEILFKHIEKLRIIFGRLRAAGWSQAQFWVKGYSLPRICNNMGRYKTWPKEITRYNRYWATKHYNINASAHWYGPVL